MEKDLKERMKKVKQSGEKLVNEFGLGKITPMLPNAYYNLLCFLIAYKTGTSLKHIQEMTYFDFVSFLYITGEFTKEGSPDGANPESRDIERNLGMA